jgi:hypothetical protein
VNAAVATIGIAVGRYGRQLVEELLCGVQQFRFLYLFGLAALATAFAVGRITHVQPDIAIVESFGAVVGLAFLVFAVLLATGGLIWLAAVRRSRTPARDIMRFLSHYTGDPSWIAAVVNTLAVIILFIVAYGTLKGAIAVISPFAWDAAPADAGKALFFGHHPYEMLAPVLNCPPAVFSVNFLYNLWYVMLVGSCLVAAGTKRPAIRHQYVMAFMACWFVGGFLVAMVFSSAGPCYYARIGLGAAFAPLMDGLHAVDARFPVWALSTQDALWEGFTGLRPGSAGISAFPSMHVASAVLMALLASSIHRVAGIVMSVYAGVILFGSVLLGWHYLVDGLVSIPFAFLVWKLSGRYARRVCAAQGIAA